MKFELSDLGDYFDRQNTRDGIEEFYLESRTWWFFEERIFFKVGAKKFIKKSIPKKIYGYEYKWVENWKTKWEKIMGEAVQIRQLERFDNGYEICQELGLEKEVRQKLYEEGVCGDNKIRDLCQGKNWIDSATLCDYLCSKYPLDEPDYENNERQMSGKKCLEECSKIFTELWENKLKKMDKEDADCIKGMAFEELEKMRPMVIGRYNEEILRQEKEIANLEWDKLGELYVIREKADKARKQIWRM